MDPRCLSPFLREDCFENLTLTTKKEEREDHWTPGSGDLAPVSDVKSLLSTKQTVC